jgi:Cof subfamily protein (haloacid dehalogenase superfamily)
MTATRRSPLATPMHPPFDLIILDLDGTVLDLYRREQVSPVVRTAIEAVQQTGIPVTVATGRTLDYVRTHVAGPLGLQRPVVTAQGAVVGDPVTGRVLRATTLSLATARRVAAWVEEEHHTTAFYLQGADGVHVYQNFAADDADSRAFHDHVFGEPRTLQPSFLPLFAAADAPAPLKFIIDNDPTTGPDLAPVLRAQFGEELSITRTHPRLVEGTAPGVDKGQGVLALCRLLQVDPQRVLAIGDSDNDIPMLKVVGYGVAMGNATPGVKAVARWVAPPIHEDGVAVALDRLIFKNK